MITPSWELGQKEKPVAVLTSFTLQGCTTKIDHHPLLLSPCVLRSRISGVHLCFLGTRGGFAHPDVNNDCSTTNSRMCLILWGRTEKCLKEAAEEISLSGTECHYFLCDVANREEVYKQAKVVREKVGDVTILVNNAAVVHGKSLIDSDDDALLKSQHINTLGQFWTTKAFLPRMLELQHGHVVCINSILSQSPIPGAIDYNTSKASSLAFMESLTLGMLDCAGVGCTTVLPFHCNTEMFQGMRVRY
ncbi:short-chain dehydrogenase/reductase 3b [Notothenia coriiceps]|uniref:Short-chain dehydrogenase/reductase 3b n=1 Tax=Notothenia coriiceps TaxID=8208 RepID=A0A6I9P2T0_9TELE|nr:PREDICTED: short-chain dehydrogenase/reductase 3 [Notothenia coriiceps]